MALFDPTAPRMIRARRAYGGLERGFDPFMKAACARCAHRKIKQDPEASNVSVCQRPRPGTELFAKSNGQVMMILPGRAG